jgi:hypothetical protein
MHDIFSQFLAVEGGYWAGKPGMGAVNGNSEPPEKGRMEGLEDITGSCPKVECLT